LWVFWLKYDYVLMIYLINYITEACGDVLNSMINKTMKAIR